LIDQISEKDPFHPGFNLSEIKNKAHREILFTRLINLTSVRLKSVREAENGQKNDKIIYF
jgi:hypothetical protein